MLEDINILYLFLNFYFLKQFNFNYFPREIERVTAVVSATLFYEANINQALYCTVALKF